MPAAEKSTFGCIYFRLLRQMQAFFLYIFDHRSDHSFSELCISFKCGTHLQLIRESQATKVHFANRFSEAVSSKRYSPLFLVSNVHWPSVSNRKRILFPSFNSFCTFSRSSPKLEITKCLTNRKNP